MLLKGHLFHGMVWRNQQPSIYIPREYPSRQRGKCNETQAQHRLNHECSAPVQGKKVSIVVRCDGRPGAFQSPLPAYVHPGNYTAPSVYLPVNQNIGSIHCSKSAARPSDGCPRCSIRSKIADSPAPCKPNEASCLLLMAPPHARDTQKGPLMTRKSTIKICG